MSAIQERLGNLSFQDTIHRSHGKEHPWLTRRGIDIRERIVPQLESLKSDPRVQAIERKYPELMPNEVDQGLIVTPYDDYEEMEIGVPPDEAIEGWRMLREEIFILANHPSRIRAMMELEKEGFKPPEERTGVINKFLDRGVIPQLSDLGHNKDSVDSVEDIFQVHRTKLLEQGPFSFTSKRRVGSFVNMGAMPDTNGSVLAIETAAKLFMRVGIPEVGFFSDSEIQARLAREVMQRLTVNDPLLEGRSKEEKQFIVDHWRASVVGVLEVDREKALPRARKLYDAGVRSFRPYGHAVGKDVVETTRILRNELGDEVEIFASQITNAHIAKECEKAGADTIIIGVGGGAKCTTPLKSQMIPANAELAWKLRGKLGIPVIGEGGAVDDIVISILVGMSGVNGSGSIGGGTFEAPGGMFFLTKDHKVFEKPYGGEASDRTKWLSKRTYSTGVPYFSEGEQSFKPLLPLQESMTQKVLGHWERIVQGAVQLGVDKGPFTISAMQSLDPSPLLEKSPTTEYVQGTH